MKKHILICCLFFVGSISVLAQENQKLIDILDKKEAEAKAGATEVSNQTKNFKSIVSDLLIFGKRNYQALIKNGILKQSDGEIQLKSNIYGLGKIFNNSWALDQNFKKLRWARNIQIGLGAVMSDENKISAFNSSLTIGLINKRELKGGDFKKYTSITAIDLANAVENIAIALQNSIDSKLSDKQKAAFKTNLDDFTSTLNFDKLKGLITDAEIADAKLKWQALVDKYDKAETKLSKAPLLTYGYEGNYGNKKWTKLNNKLEFIVGLGNKKDDNRNYDFYSGLFYDMQQDTLNKFSSLNRSSFTAKVGINKVLLKAKSDGASIIEAFGGAEYSNIDKGIYLNEKKQSFKMDLTLSVRIASNLYLPFQLKYNQTTGRFEGYLDLKFDIVNIFR